MSAPVSRVLYGLHRDRRGYHHDPRSPAHLDHVPVADHQRNPAADRAYHNAQACEQSIDHGGACEFEADERYHLDHGRRPHSAHRHAARDEFYTIARYNERISSCTLRQRSILIGMDYNR